MIGILVFHDSFFLKWVMTTVVPVACHPIKADSDFSFSWELFVGEVVAILRSYQLSKQE